MSEKVKIQYYYKGENNKPLVNAVAVILYDKVLYFSYETLIAFEIGGRLIISENIWGNTTGKHLNAIDPNKKRRLSHDKFLEAVEKQLQVTVL